MISKSPYEYYLISETVVSEDTAMSKREILHENTTGGAGRNLFTLTFKQALQDFGVQNWNGRKYSQEIVVGGIDRNPLIQHDLKMKTWTGEYGHPIIEKGMNELARQMTIFPPNACNTIDKYWVEGNCLMGECTTLAGGFGDLVRDRILTGYPAMASSRAIGGVDKNGNVLPGYTPITFDTVIRPSHKIAYQVAGSEQVNTFGLPNGNTMSECAISVRPNSAAVKDFLLSETVSRDRINKVCDVMGLQFDTMQVSGGNVTIKKINEGAVETLVMPLNSLVATEYYNLF